MYVSYMLQECVESDPSLFYQLLPVMYKKFSKDLAGNHELLNLIVANIDPNQVRYGYFVQNEFLASSTGID